MIALSSGTPGSLKFGKTPNIYKKIAILKLIHFLVFVWF